MMRSLTFDMLGARPKSRQGTYPEPDPRPSLSHPRELPQRVGLGIGTRGTQVHHARVRVARSGENNHTIGRPKVNELIN
jgi:hypothetical protein